MKIAFGVDWRPEALLWVGKRGLIVGDPPLTKPSKRGDFPPIPPLWRVGRESPGPRHEEGI